MTIYVVGDVHGCGDEFKALLDKIAFDPSADRLWLVGDLINRGPRSLDCMRLARQLDAVMVLGNHDLHFLAIAAGIQKSKKKDTVTDILDAPDSAELVDWLRTRPLLVTSPDSSLCMVHAGILPQWSLGMAQKLAAEIEASLSGNDWMALMANLYGDVPDLFDDTLRGWARQRAIINVFTRMRFIDSQGRLDFASKLGPDTAPEGFKAWFQYPRKDQLRILFGHWAALQGQASDAAISCDALDTGCAWGGALTALNLDTCQRTSVQAGDIKSIKH